MNTPKHRWIDSRTVQLVVEEDLPLAEALLRAVAEWHATQDRHAAQFAPIAQTGTH